jgi:hypothetical protein
VELTRHDLVRAAGDGARERADRLATVEREIRRAQAEALGRTGERLQSLLDRLAAADRRLDALLLDVEAATVDVAEAGARADRVRSELEARNRIRDESDRVRHHLIIQREALGLARQTPVEQCYPVPGRRPDPRPATHPGREP